MTVFEACEIGNLTWLKQQTAAGTLPDLMQKDDRHWYPHELAAKNGHLDVVKWLAKESGQCVDVTASDNNAVRLAAKNGHLGVVKWLIKDSGQPVDVTARDNDAVRMAAKNGHLDVVTWLVLDYTDWLAVKKLEDPSFTGSLVDVTAIDEHSAFQCAALNGHLDVLKWLVNLSSEAHVKDDPKWFAVKKLEDPSFAGQPVDVTTKKSYAVYLAAQNGHLDVVKWLVNLSAETHVQDSGQPVDVIANANQVVQTAAANGHLDVVRWLVLEWPATEAFKQSGQSVDVTADNNYTLCLAAGNGHLHVVRWLVEDSGQPVDIITGNNYSRRWSTQNGHQAVVDYFNFVTPLIQAVGLEAFRASLTKLPKLRATALKM